MRQQFVQFIDRVPHVMLFAQGVRNESRTAGVANILFALADFIEISRQAPVFWKNIDLEDQATAARIIINYVLQWRVGEETSIPILFAINLDRRKARRQRPTGHDVFWANRDFFAVEI